MNSMVNFGILYGRGGRDTAIQVKAETGAAESIDVLAAQLDQVIKTWKEVEYPVAWAFIERCMAQVYDPGYIKNPFGRIRRAPFLLRGQRDAGAERNFANFPRPILNGEVKLGELREARSYCAQSLVMVQYSVPMVILSQATLGGVEGATTRGRGQNGQ